MPITEETFKPFETVFHDEDIRREERERAIRIILGNPDFRGEMLADMVRGGMPR